MNVTVTYLAQLRRAAGCSQTVVAMAAGQSIKTLLALLRESVPGLRSMVFDPEGNLRPTILIFVGDEQVQPDRILCDGDEVALMTPIAGGSDSCLLLPLAMGKSLDQGMSPPAKRGGKT